VVSHILLPPYTPPISVIAIGRIVYPKVFEGWRSQGGWETACKSGKGGAAPLTYTLSSPREEIKRWGVVTTITLNSTRLSESRGEIP
jgi:hypothetical protein